MDIQTLQIVLQSASSVLIASGLIFAGLQFRHWLRVAHVGNFTKMVELQMHLREMRVTDPKLAYVYAHDVEGRADEREIREYFFNLMQLSVFEIVWFSHREGLLPRDYFLSWESRMKEIATEESFQSMFRSRSLKILHDDFERYVETMVKEAHLHPYPSSPHAPQPAR